jgi:magnesium chelatase subunit D
MRLDFPFSAVVGQDDLKLALLLIAVDPSIGGVLISGERGTAKSTVARGLAGLLPDLATGRPAPFVELPLGATEDRVVGSLNISRILQDGKSELRSGLLARANGGVLYVDEVNLLPDALVDLLLDAAASGWVTVERDGISASEPARFVLIGTMNPEEGELRPQFLDRFGLCVQVRGPATPEARIEAIRQRLSFDDSPATAREAAQPAEEALRLRIVGARDRLKTLAISDAHLAIVAALAAEHQADGIRGDLAVIKSARALAAWTNAATVTEEHIHRAAQFALVHRARHNKTRQAKRSASAPTLVPDTPSLYAPSATTPTAAADLGATRLVTDLIDSDQPGRHGADAFGRQRIVGAAPFESAGTLAVGQTLVSAAVRGARVTAQGVALRAEDLKSHERRGAGSSHVLFLVDASGSMGTNRRLELAKGAALGLLKSSYQRRDEVALMSFRSDGTELVLPFTRDVPKVERALSDVATGGRTPLARALSDATELLQTRAPSLLVLFTDGRANVGLGGGDPWDETLAAAKPLRSACAGVLVIDCERGPILLGRALVLAEVLGAEYVALGDLDATALTIRIDRRLADL